MELTQQEPDLSAYLAADDVMDHEHPLVRETARRLGAGALDAYAYAAAAYAHVRDDIPHSSDTGDPRVTWRASHVLEARTGICCAKAHALAALLRAGGVPAGLCYQRLTDDGARPAVHGLIAVRLPGSTGWARQDPRGNKPGVDAHFSVDEEKLAWVPRAEYGEVDYPLVHAVAHPAILHALRNARDRPALWRDYPTAL
ncbi:transglutaminase domain-containing protein [Streptomyces sp. SID3915]|uniref:transglutaminase domain-containing protein n=1 Tax=Streptomyces sp. SID3915 TaxID=2690263 RepID=UPI00136FFED1|nr:transglutaminase domain-containing protein [Streptomyces sp. SID3915]MYX76544.1 transglutaminase [Streptomyces sp. SID3915]